MSSKIVRPSKSAADAESPSIDSTTKVNAITHALLHWFSESARDLPWRRTRDPYAIWVSEIMLQQTQVKTVIPYWERWMKALPTIASLAEAPPERIHKLWEGLGYYTRVRNMQKAAQEILAKHNGRFPDDFDSILALQGIGRYTAGAIASIAFNQPKPLLDGNVIRVLTRLFGIDTNPREKSTNQQLWNLAEALVIAASNSEKSSTSKNSSPACSHLNQSLMELGALICTPKNPQCLICPVRPHCDAYRNGKVDELPNLGERIIATPRHFFAYVLQHNDRFLVRQRPAGIVNAHLWEFPNFEVKVGSKSDPQEVASLHMNFKLKSLSHLCTIRHTITRYRITLDVFQASLASVPKSKSLSGNWQTSTQLHQLPFPSAHKKILKIATSAKLPK